MSFQVFDRYSALGIDYPNPDTCCLGQCEGTGYVPVRKGDKDPEFAELWRAAHFKSHSLFNVIKTAWRYKDIKWLWKGFECDDWHFVKCPECKGTGKREPQP